MADYRKMYLHLFNAVTKMVTGLQEAQQATEEMFLESKETAIKLESDTDDSDYP